MDVENDCCANAAAGEPATCQDGWVPTAQPDSWDGCAETGSNYGCVPEGGAYALNGRSCDDAPPQRVSVLRQVNQQLLAKMQRGY